MVNKSDEKIVLVSIAILGIILFLTITGIVLKNKEEVRIQDKNAIIAEEISEILMNLDNRLSSGQSDTVFLSNTEDIRGYAQTSNIALINSSTELFLVYAKANKRYYQLEYINDTGKELIRIYYEPSISDYAAMPHQELSNLSDVPYWKKTTGLSRGEIYISDIYPASPSSSEGQDESIITYAIPVFNSTGVGKGIVAVSLRVDTILDDIHKELKRKGHDEDYFIVNRDGEYIYNYQNRAKEFTKYTGYDENLFDDFPGTARIMLSGTDGNALDIRSGLAVFSNYRYNPSNLSQYIVIIGVNKFALIYQMLLDGVVVVMGLLSYGFFIYAYRNFIKGDFKKLLSSMLLILTFFFIYKFLEISETYFENIQGIFIFEQTALVLGLLMIIMFAHQLLEFSKLYGFAYKKTFKK